ncbi:MAG: hypothetical protein K2H30_06360 [Clostridia bacterium]|nr:hypothetical protein [Clostridia bacterium]
MICWYCKNLIPDDAHVCPYCRVAVAKPASEEFRQNGYVNPYEQYYHNYQLPQQLNPASTGQYYQGMGGMQMPQYPASPNMPMQNPYAPYQVVGVIYPQAQQPQKKVWVRPQEDEKPEIEDVVKDEPVVILDQSDLKGRYPARAAHRLNENKKAEAEKAEAKNAEAETTAVDEPKKKNVIAIVGLVFAFILPLIGLILSCIGVARAETKNYDKCGLAIGGVVVSIVLMIAYPALMFIFSEPLLTMLGF